MRKLLIILVTIGLMFGLLGASQMQQQAVPELFAQPANPLQARNSARPGAGEVIRSRQVAVNTQILHEIVQNHSGSAVPVPAAFVLNLFDDVSYVADIYTIEQLGGGSFGLVGQVNSTGYNELVMVVRGEMIQGYVQDGQNVYEIQFDGQGHTIFEVDSSAYPGYLHPPEQGQVLGESAQPDADLIAADSGDQIDVLAVYTPGARVALGGTAAIETRIQNSILSANTGYTNSGIVQQVNLVGMEEVSYSEDIPGATYDDEWVAALHRLTFGYYTSPPVNDPVSATYLADARAYREAYGADLVFMVTDLPYFYCGLGWVAGSSGAAEYGFSVVHYNCTGTSAYSVQHEMGHNMGACHDRANSSITCMFDYSYGYQQPNQFYTVMAYAAGCADEGFSCTRINRWSNPDLTYNGFPTGVAITEPNSAHNALTLNNTAYNVANYRQSVPPAVVSGSFTMPVDGGQAMIPRDYLEVDVSSTAGSITTVTYQAFYDGSWHTVHVDDNSSDGWRYLWPTAGISSQTIDLRAEVEDSLGNTGMIYASNISLRSSYVFGNGYETRGAEQTEEAAEEIAAQEPLVEEQSVALVEMQAASTEVLRWHSLAVRKFLY